MRANFITSEGVQGRTSSQRRFVVVHMASAEIIYRTDDLVRANDRRRRLGITRYEIIDTHAAAGLA